MQDIKLKNGEQAERLVASYWTDMGFTVEFHPDEYWPPWDFRVVETGLTVEVKFDSYAANSGLVYVEYEQMNYGRWRPSGVLTSEANIYVFVLDIEREWAVGIETEGLRHLVLDAAQHGHIRMTNHKTAQADGKWPPTRGALVAIKDMQS